LQQLPIQFLQPNCACMGMIFFDYMLINILKNNQIHNWILFSHYSRLLVIQILPKKQDSKSCSICFFFFEKHYKCSYQGDSSPSIAMPITKVEQNLNTQMEHSHPLIDPNVRHTKEAILFGHFMIVKSLTY
jgi:hypothetical protein